jgi:hypothetical protein
LVRWSSLVMAKITTDFNGTETTAITKARLTEIVEYFWGTGVLTNATTWGEVRLLLNKVGFPSHQINDNELAAAFRAKLNHLNETDNAPLGLDFTSGSLPAGVSFTRAGTATYFDAAGVLRTAAADQPRFDHDPVTKAPKGLLIEGSRTNLLLQSNDVGSASWSNQNATVTVGATPSPLGLAADVVEATPIGTHGVNQAVNVTTGTAYTFSFYAKAKGRSLLRAGASNLNAYAVFDLSAGTVQYTDAGVTAKIEAAGGGWYRCAVTQTAAATATYNWILRTQSATSEWPGSGAYTGDGVSGVSIIGAQLEVGAFPSSYIPTTTATATRAADICVMTGTNFSRWFNPLEGTFLVEFYRDLHFAAGNLLSAARTAPGYGPRHQLAITSTNRIEYAVVGSAGAVAFQKSVPYSVAGRQRMSAAYGSSDFAVAVNGAPAITGPSADLPNAIDALYIGIDETGWVQPYGHISRIRYWPTRLPNSFLQRATA